MNKIHIFQHNDADGFSAAYLVNKFLTKDYIKKDINFYVMNYDEKEVDEALEKINTDDAVWIVDYSLQPEKMIELLKKTKNVVWIDHHKSAIRKYDDWADLIEEATGLDYIPGIRLEGLCGAALTYLYLFRGWTDTAMRELRDTCFNETVIITTLKQEFIESAPRWLKLVNDWDVWDLKMLPDSKQLQISTQADLSIELYTQLDNDIAEENLCEYLCKGESYLEYRDQWASTFRKRYGFKKELDFGDGRAYSVYLMNLGNGNSDFFGKELDNNEICMNYCYNGDKVTFSLYSNKPNVDCGAIATTFGGGGHPGAAGFSTDVVEAQEIIL